MTEMKLRVFTAFSGYDSQCMALQRYEDSFKRETRLGGARRLVGERNDLIEAVARATMRFLKEYNKNGRDIDFNSSKDIDDCVNIICKHIVQFISKKIDN